MSKFKFQISHKEGWRENLRQKNNEAESCEGKHRGRETLQANKTILDRRIAYPVENSLNVPVFSNEMLSEGDDGGRLDGAATPSEDKFLLGR